MSLSPLMAQLSASFADVSPLLDTEQLPWYMPVAAAAFFAGGVVMLIGTLRSTLTLSKRKLEEDVRKWQAQSEFWRTMDSAVAQLAESVEAASKELKDREQTIDRLTKEASEAISRLERLMAEANAAASIPPAKSTRRIRPASGPVDGDERPTAEVEVANEPAEDQGSTGRVVRMDTARDQIARRHRRVYEMFDSGHTVLDISKETSLNIGEIELILAIRQRGVGG